MLASTRGLVGLGVLAVLVGVGIAAGAAVTGGPAAPAARAAVPPSTVRSTGADVISGSATAVNVAVDPLTGTPVDGGQLIIHYSDPTSSGSQSQNPSDSTPVSALAASGIPITALKAYKQAAAREAKLDPACGLSWPLLAGIGRVESDHGRFAGAVLHSDGVSTPPIIGIPLNGHGTALIRATPTGPALDGDPVYDHAVGPMQFIPSTWASWGVDANGDGIKDPFNIFDATAAAADYLCAAGHDLTTTHGQVQAILSYNYSYDYVRLVMSLEQVYAKDVGISVPILPTSPEPTQGPPKHKPKLPPVDPGKPRGVNPPPGSTSSPPPNPGSKTTSPAPKNSPTLSPRPSYTRPSNPRTPPSSTPPSSPTSTSPTPSPSPSCSTSTDSGSPTDSPTPTDSSSPCGSASANSGSSSGSSSSDSSSSP